MFISFLFFKLKIIIQYIKNISTQFQEFYFKIESKVFYFILFSILFCFIIRSFNVDGDISGGLIVLSFFIVFIHYILSLFIPEKFEEEEITESIFLSGNRNKILLKKLYKVALAILFLGLMFKIMHFPGAGMLMVIGSFFLSIYFILGQKTKTNNKLLGFLYRLSFSLMIIGGIFNMMDWPWASNLRVISVSILLVSAIVLFFYKNQLFQSTKNITITFTILAILLQFSLFRFALTTLSFNYPIYLEKIEIAKIRMKVTKPSNEEDAFNGYVEAKSKPELDSLKYYMKKNDKYLHKIGPHDLNEYCQILLDKQTDTTILIHGLKWSNWIVSKDPYYLHYTTNIKYLIALEKYELALKTIKIAEKNEESSEDKEFKKELKKLKNLCLQNTQNIK